MSRLLYQYQPGLVGLFVVSFILQGGSGVGLEFAPFESQKHFKTFDAYRQSNAASLGYNSVRLLAGFGTRFTMMLIHTIRFWPVEGLFGSPDTPVFFVIAKATGNGNSKFLGCCPDCPLICWRDNKAVIDIQTTEKLLPSTLSCLSARRYFHTFFNLDLSIGCGIMFVHDPYKSHI